MRNIGPVNVVTATLGGGLCWHVHLGQRQAEGIFQLMILTFSMFNEMRLYFIDTIPYNPY